MNILDIVLLLCLLPAVIQGLRKGFIAQVVAIVAIVLGGWLAYRFSSVLTTWINQWIDAPGSVLQIIAFTLIFVLVAIGLFLLGKLLETSIKIILLGWLNKLLGIVFALFKFALVLGLLIIVFDTINDKFEFVSMSYLDDSIMYTGFKRVAYAVFPYLKKLLF